METYALEVTFMVTCYECGEELAVKDVKKTTNIIVIPCANCLQAKYAEGREAMTN